MTMNMVPEMVNTIRERLRGELVRMISSLRHPEAPEEEHRKKGRGIEPKSPAAPKDRDNEKGLKGHAHPLPTKKRKKKKKGKKGNKTTATSTAVVGSTTVPGLNIWGGDLSQGRAPPPLAPVAPQDEAWSTVVRGAGGGLVGRGVVVLVRLPQAGLGVVLGWELAGAGRAGVLPLLPAVVWAPRRLVKPCQKSPNPRRFQFFARRGNMGTP